MSDALSESRREEENDRRVDQLLKAFEALVISDSIATRAAVRACSSFCEGTVDPCWGLGSTLTEKLDQLLDGLAKHDKTAWAWLLRLAQSRGYMGYDQMLSLSPWTGKQMALLSFGRHATGLERILESSMHLAGNGTIFSWNPSGYFRYAVFFEPSDTLLTIAKSAVCLGMVKTSMFGNQSDLYIIPRSHRLVDLQTRDYAFRQMSEMRGASASLRNPSDFCDAPTRGTAC